MRESDKLLGSNLFSYHPRVIIRVHQFCAFANCQGKSTHFEVVTICLVNQKASIKGYLRKLSLKIDKLLSSSMLSHHPGVCKGTLHLKKL